MAEVTPWFALFDNGLVEFVGEFVSFNDADSSGNKNKDGYQLLWLFEVEDVRRLERSIKQAYVQAGISDSFSDPQYRLHVAYAAGVRAAHVHGVRARQWIARIWIWYRHVHVRLEKAMRMSWLLSG